MSAYNISWDLRHAVSGFAALLTAALFLCVPPARAAHRHYRHSRTSRSHSAVSHPRATHPRAVHSRSVHPRAHRARVIHSARKRKQSALDIDRPAIHAEIARLPLESYRALPPLRGSRESLLRQNERADEEGLTRITDEAMLLAMAHDGALVRIPVSARLSVDPRLEADRRYCRPWTARFLSDLARQYYARFHSALRVDSAVRTVEYQQHLLRVNANAAPAEGDIRSPHLTGEAVDIGKKGLSRNEIGWLRAYLLPLQAVGKVDVEEEFHQACFHISVYQSYAPPSRVAPPVAPRRSTRRHRRTTPLLATRLP